MGNVWQLSKTNGTAGTIKLIAESDGLSTAEVKIEVNSKIKVKFKIAGHIHLYFKLL